ncbi:hypothetical protein [Swingsia samuiensis]|uniref:Glycosyltransferase family 2 protein n=1 Tax=Swingsia samuiensis TaxID=1293412 RepID=A0A4Y6UH67_9PROT|nr:hypothetical protein [Swingsia samuiensis]QDH16364.1 hypothetical protein E3D00_01380 [Swingsia samuiensis]
MTSAPHIFIATPCFNSSVTLPYMHSLIACMAEASQHNIKLTLSTLGSDALITRARNTLLHQFMTMTDASHILFIDSDIGFEFSDILALLAAQKPIIGGAYPLKNHYWDDETTHRIQQGEPAQTASLRYVGDNNSLNHENASTNHVVEVPYIGTGFMLLSRDAIQKLIVAYPQTQYSRIDAKQTGHTAATHAKAFALFDCIIHPTTQTYLSEDFAFCHRWASLGGKIWLHRGFNLSHTGNTTFFGQLNNRLTKKL